MNSSTVDTLHMPEKIPLPKITVTVDVLYSHVTLVRLRIIIIIGKNLHILNAFCIRTIHVQTQPPGSLIKVVFCYCYKQRMTIKRSQISTPTSCPASSG